MNQPLPFPAPSQPDPAECAADPAVPPEDRARLAALWSKAEWAQGVVRMSKALLDAGRRIDIAGLDQTIGQICAGALDLGPERCGTLRPRMMALLVEMDALTAALRAGGRLA